MLRAAREKGRVTHKGKPIRLTVELSAETLQAGREWGGQYSTPLKKRIFNLKFLSNQTKLHKQKRNKILYKQAIAERFHYNQACLTRAPERSTKHRKEQPVPATPKTQQMVKSIDTMKKLHQLMGKTTS